MAHQPHNPLAQFEIKYLTNYPDIAGMNFNFSNSSLYMVAVVIFLSLFFALGIKKKAIVPSRWQSMVEMAYEFVAVTVKENVGNEGRRYFPFIFSLFMFILVANLFGMLPYSFTVTSHLAVTFTLAIIIFFGVTIIAIARHGFKFLEYFLPHGTPWWLLPLMFVIELFAYLVRPVSLSIRLSANMMAGHILLKVMAGFVISMGVAGLFLPFPFIVVMIGFEIFVAILQAYIFTILTCVYLNDAIHLH